MNGAGGEQADVEIGEAHGEEAAPGEEHVALVQKSGETPDGETGAAERGAREAIEFASGEMAEGVAGKGVERKERDVDGEDQRANANAEPAVEEEGADGVVPEKTNKEDGNIEKITVKILQDERKLRFATVFAAGRFTHGASGRVQKKRAVVGFAVIVASSAKSEWASKNQERR